MFRFKKPTQIAKADVSLFNSLYLFGQSSKNSGSQDIAEKSVISDDSRRQNSACYKLLNGEPLSKMLILMFKVSGDGTSTSIKLVIWLA